MSQNRKVSPNTLKLFECCESGNLKSVLELIHLEDVDLDWKKSASVRLSIVVSADSLNYDYIVRSERVDCSVDA